MKRFLLSAMLFSGIFANAQEDYTATTVSLGAGYTNQVYFDFSTEAQTPVATTAWDLAFLRTSAMSTGIRVNDSRAIEVFEASNNVADWAAIDVANEASWTPLYNSETAWETGAFDNGSATYGWGEYNPANHHVTGSVIFVLKYTDGSYKKLIVQDYYGGYTIQYATWDGTAWSADETAVIPNGSSNNTFNYFSLDTDAVVTVAPADADWDLAFTRYYGNVGTDEEPMMYLVSGVLHNSATVTVAQADETGATDNEPTAPAEEDYSEDINTIGDDWKSFNMTTFSYDIDGETTYYVKHTDGTIYRVYFTGFGGTSNGNMEFNYKNITQTAGVETVNGITFGIYPNPTTDKNITLIYDLNGGNDAKNKVSVYSVTGAKVFETEISNNSGFYTNQINLSQLTEGIYIVQLEAGDTTVSKKLVIR